MHKKGIRFGLPFSTLVILKPQITAVLQRDLPKTVIWGLLATFFVYITVWFVDLREGAPARYAAMTVEMLQSGEYFYFMTSDTGHTDKPPLLLWLSGLSMTLFGLNHIAYRLTGLLPALLAIYSVFRFSRIYYSKETSLLAALILATTEAMFVLNNEVGTLNYLAAFYIFTIWQLAEYLRSKRLHNILLGICGAGFLLLSHGRMIMNPAEGFAPFRLTITSIWSFAPWSLFLFLGIWLRIKETFKPTSPDIKTEQISLYGFLIPFILLSLNPFQSIHDGFIVYPLGAVISADYIVRSFYINETKFAGNLYLLQILLSYIAIAGLFWLVWFPFPDNNYYGLIHYMALLSAFTWLVFFSEIRHKLVLSCTILAVGFNLVLNSYYYPNIANYQAGAKLGLLAKEDGVKRGRLFSYQTNDSSLLHFYAGVPVQKCADFKSLINMKNCWIYTHQSLLEEFRALRPDLKMIGRSPDFKDAPAQIRFLNPEAREKTLTRMILIRL